MNAHQLCMKIQRNAIKSLALAKLAVTSGISIHQNVCIDWTHLLTPFVFLLSQKLVIFNKSSQFVELSKKVYPS